MSTHRIMARVLISSCALLISWTLRAEEASSLESEQWQFAIGLMFVNAQTTWTEAEDQNLLLPYFSAAKGPWQIGGDSLLRYQLYAKDDAAFSIGIGYEDEGFGGIFTKPDSYGEVFEGYDNPDGTLTAEAQAQWLLFAITASHAVNGEADTATLGANMTYPLFQYNEVFAVEAEIGALWMNRDFTRQYFGVSESQQDASVGRVFYRPDSALNYHWSISISYMLSEQWGVILHYKQQYLDNELLNSPLIDSDTSKQLAFGIQYQF
ncbi:MAG: MipA/OmpV family protein [Alteromonadaceae bacterium]|nr:MipA/OmpV family protein [Alteromonadaceae bacterium]